MRRKGADEDRTERVGMRATPTLKRAMEGFASDLGAHLHRPVTLTEAVEIAVSSGAAALARGELRVALAVPPGQGLAAASPLPEPPKARRERPG